MVHEVLVKWKERANASMEDKGFKGDGHDVMRLAWNAGSDVISTYRCDVLATSLPVKQSRTIITSISYSLKRMIDIIKYHCNISRECLSSTLAAVRESIPV